MSEFHTVFVVCVAIVAIVGYAVGVDELPDITSFHGFVLFMLFWLALGYSVIVSVAALGVWLLERA